MRPTQSGHTYPQVCVCVCVCVTQVESAELREKHLVYERRVTGIDEAQDTLIHETQVLLAQKNEALSKIKQVRVMGSVHIHTVMRRSMCAGMCMFWPAGQAIRARHSRLSGLGPAYINACMCVCVCVCVCVQYESELAMHRETVKALHAELDQAHETNQQLRDEYDRVRHTHTHTHTHNSTYVCSVSYKYKNTNTHMGALYAAHMGALHKHTRI